MLPKPRDSNASMVEDLIIALRDEHVLGAIGALFETRLQGMLASVNELQKDSEKKSKEIAQLKTDLNQAHAKILALEAHSRADNLIIAGLPCTSYSEAAAVNMSGPNAAVPENNRDTERAVLKLCNLLELPLPQ